MGLDSARVEAVFNEAVALSTGSERASFMERACGDDQILRNRVESLLAAHERADGFLANVPSPVGGAGASLTEGPGSVIGRYKLLEQIGEGGFGVVFMADQREPVRRKVALKIIKLGMDTRQVVARFEAERQALAMMDHPNIAKVLDGGSTDTGRPYFVMELVRGVPITAFSDENRLTPRQRLELFLPVCSAIQHAHQKGIIHRDLKPNNVLVTMHDDKPVPMIIDFGIAKAAQSRLTDKTLFTEFHQFVGTPAYMSPEQAQMSALDVDTRSDVYSMGVLLYEMLTGATPFDAHELRSAAHAEMQRIIREVEPPKPSTRWSTMAAPAQSALAAHRQCDPKVLGRTLSGDLDWIIMRCLEKDRSRRYETASGLARDVQRYLSHEPVEASPPSATYKLRKAIRRHKKETIAIASIIGTLVLGIVGTTFGLARARENLRIATDAQRQLREERDSANADAAKSRQLAQLNKANVVEWVSKMIEVLPESSDQRFDALWTRAKLNLSLGRFSEAESDMIVLVRSRQCGSQTLENIGSAMVFLGYTAEYRDTCVALRDQYSGSRDAAAMERVAKTSMLIPSVAGVEPSQALAWVDRGLTYTTDDNLIAWLCMTRSLVLYRAGDWAGCVEWANKVNTTTSSMPIAHLLAAMGYTRLGRVREAMAAYDRAEQQIAAASPGYPQDTIGDTGENWLNYQILRREAQSLFKAGG